MSNIKLTNEQIQAIKALDADEYVDMHDLGKLLGISTNQARYWARWNCKAVKLNGDFYTPDCHSKHHYYVLAGDVRKMLEVYDLLKESK